MDWKSYVGNWFKLPNSLKINTKYFYQLCCIQRGVIVSKTISTGENWVLYNVQREDLKCEDIPANHSVMNDDE